MLLKIIRFFTIILVSSIAVYYDIKSNKIPNKLTLSTILLGLIAVLFQGTYAISDTVYGIIFPFIVCIPFYSLRMLGAGDVKLYCALGAIMGLNWIIKCMIYSIISGGVIALFLMIKRRNFLERIKYLLNYFKLLFLAKNIPKYQSFTSDNKSLFPYSVAIFVGGLLSFIF